MGRFLALSLGVHALALILLAVPFSRNPPPLYAEPVYQVALVEWPETNFKPPVPTHTPEVKQPKPEPEKPKPKPEPKKPDEVRVAEKPKPKPEKKEPEKQPEVAPKPEKKAETPPQEEAPPEKKVDIPDTPEEPVSLGMVDQKDFREDFYLELVRGILARAWDRPRVGKGVVRTTVHFVIRRDGTVVQPYVMEPSGIALYDRAAMAAVDRVKDRLPPLPESYSGDQIGLSVVFQSMGEQP